MTIETLIQDLPLRLIHGDGQLDLTDLTDDSRQVRPGALFVARPGEDHDGGKYIPDALARGAAAVLAPPEAAGPPKAPPLTPEGKPVAWIAADRVDQALAGTLAERFFDHPSRKLKLIGVTGTNGKTTTAYLIQYLLQEAGVPCGMIGTVVVDDGRQRRPAELTTPGAIEFSRLLAAMVSHGCQAAVAEVSSHALEQGRTRTLAFDVGVFTNLTGDHLDYHGTMEHYAAAKARLFEGLGPQGWAVVNQDDPYAERMLQDCRARVMGCTLGAGPDASEGPDVDADQRICRAKVVSLAADHSQARFDGPWGSVEARLPLVGRHNIANALQAIAAASAVTAVARVLRSVLGRCPAVPGRLEPVGVDSPAILAGTDRGVADYAPATLEDRPTVLVDYAHTHDALENVLLALRPVTRGRLIVLFGCGGDRDHTKRPKMAAVACRLADRVTITSDNPRTEDPQAIIEQILAGVPSDQRSKVTVEVDRAAAIANTIQAAGPDDTVLLAGKGHEDYQIIGKQKFPFDDRKQAAAALQQYGQVTRESM